MVNVWMIAEIVTMTKLVALPRNEIDARMDHALIIVMVDLSQLVQGEPLPAKMDHVKKLVPPHLNHQKMVVEPQNVVGMVLALLDRRLALRKYLTLDT